jgi:hypothetical protein
MAQVAQFLNLNLSARTVSPHPPSIDANKNDQVGENDMKEVGEVGYKFRKQFGLMGWFTGTVVKKLPKPYYLRRCVYTEDGDVEDLRVTDLVELAKLDKKSTVSSKQSTAIKKNRSSVTSQSATSSAKKRKRVISTIAPSIKKSNEGAVAKSKHPTLRKTNQFVTLLGKKTDKHVMGRCRCKDCEGMYDGGNSRSTWVCSACTRDGGVDPKQWWICDLEKRPECWQKHCRVRIIFDKL